MHIQAAQLAFDGNGTPFAPAYGDVYHSADSGPGQARHVFIAGNDLPRRWANVRVFTILETGFGFGLNFLATWDQWRADPARPDSLHFVSIEKHPFERDALAHLHLRYGEFGPLAAQLQQAWPPLVPGLHRLHFEDDRIALTLAFGDVAELLPRLCLGADAIYLDGFSPRCNPQMWSPQLLKRLARLARPGATLATYSSAGAVREGLDAAGFRVEKRPGFGRKREMLCASYAPRWTSRNAVKAAPIATRLHAIVVGSGLAGAAVSERLAARGWRIDLIERGPARESSSPTGFAGVFHPHVSRDDCILSRTSRNGYLYAIRRWRALERYRPEFAFQRCGVLQLSADPEREQWMSATIAALGHPAEYVEYVGRSRAEALAGCELRSGGWWFPGAGSVRPSSLVCAQLAAAAAHGRTGSPFATHNSPVHSIARGGEGWLALGSDGALIAAAPILVLANSHDATRLAPVGQIIDRIRGQITYVPAEKIASPRTVLTGRGYVLPAADGVVLTGATYDRADEDAAPQARGHEANLSRLSHLLPQAFKEPVFASELDGAVGFRCAAPDRMPLVGAVPDVDEARLRKRDLTGAHLADVPRRAGLYCVTGLASRGLIWAALAGEMLGSLLEGEPSPLECDLADALDPGRFVLRQLRCGTL